MTIVDDHRIIENAVVSTFCQFPAKVLETPELLIL